MPKSFDEMRSKITREINLVNACFHTRIQRHRAVKMFEILRVEEIKHIALRIDISFKSHPGNLAKCF